MSKVFLVATYRPDSDEKLMQAIRDKYPNNHYSIGRGQWLVAVKGTTAREIAEQLGIPGETPIRGSYVFGISGYYGRANGEMWEWMSAKLGEQE
jgi:hypothetical protein